MTNSLSESACCPHTVPEGTTVLLVEDERDMCRVIQERLTRDGMTIATAANSAEALAKLRQVAPKIIVMDVRLGREDGITLAGTMRETTDAPILFVSGASTPEIRSRAFECGASDFIPKPFALGEFCARFRALLRLAARAQKPPASVASPTPATLRYEFAGWTFIPDRRQLISPIGLAHDVRQPHYELLNSFMSAPNHLIPFDGVLDQGGNGPAPDVLRSNMKTLRRLLGADSFETSLIKTTKKVGYQLTATVIVHDPMSAAVD